MKTDNGGRNIRNGNYRERKKELQQGRNVSKNKSRIIPLQKIGGILANSTQMDSTGTFSLV